MRRSAILLTVLLGARMFTAATASASSTNPSERELAGDIGVAWAHARVSAFNAMRAPLSDDRRQAALDAVTGAQVDDMTGYLDALAEAGAWLDEQDWTGTWFSVHTQPRFVDSNKGDVAALVCEVSAFVIVHRGMLPGDPPLIADVGSTHFKAWFVRVGDQWKLSKMKQVSKFRGGTRCGDPELGPVTVVPTSHIEVTRYP